MFVLKEAVCYFWDHYTVSPKLFFIRALSFFPGPYTIISVRFLNLQFSFWDCCYPLFNIRIKLFFNFSLQPFSSSLLVRLPRILTGFQLQLVEFYLLRFFLSVGYSLNVHSGFVKYCVQFVFFACSISHILNFNPSYIPHLVWLVYLP